MAIDPGENRLLGVQPQHQGHLLAGLRADSVKLLRNQAGPADFHGSAVWPAAGFRSCGTLAGVHAARSARGEELFCFALPGAVGDAQPVAARQVDNGRRLERHAQGLEKRFVLRAGTGAEVVGQLTQQALRPPA